MKTEILTPSVHVAIGDKLQSNSTIFINGPDVFPVEAMAAREDALFYVPRATLNPGKRLSSEGHFIPSSTSVEARRIRRAGIAVARGIVRNGVETGLVVTNRFQTEG